MSRRIKPVLLKVLLAVLVLTATACSAGPEPVRVLTYNIHHGEGTDGEFDLERLAGVIESARPDVVALQEVDMGTERASGVRQATRLGELTGMKVVFGRTQDYDGGEFGNAILTRLEPVRDIQNAPLPSTESTAEKTHYPRGAIAVDVQSEQWGFRVISTHFQHNLEADRIAQAKKINELFATKPGSPMTILAGDLNAEPGSEPMRILGKHWADAAADNPQPTIPVENPTRRIDYVLYRPAGMWRVIEAKVLDEKVASDHRAVLAVLQPRPWQEPFPDEAAERERYRQTKDAQRQLRSAGP